MSIDERWTELNRRCQIIRLDEQRLRAVLDRERPWLHDSIRAKQPHMFSRSPVFITPKHVEAMQQVVKAVENVAATSAYTARVLARAPEIARVDHGPSGVFFGYDFHLGKDGPKLIEINTNAGGALLNVALAQAQRTCCPQVESMFSGPHDIKHIESTLVSMFRNEWQAQRGEQPLRRIVIVDEDPEAQYLYPEFVLAKEMFVRAGLEAVVADPSRLELRDGALTCDGEVVDLVYNRLTDFYLAKHGVLAQAYRSGAAVITPNPRAYGLFADKRNLILLSDADGLRALGAPESAIEVLESGVPHTECVTPERADELWVRRKQLFFKPATGFGSRAAYRGAKLTKKTWASIIAADSQSDRAYVAQALVSPSEHSIDSEGEAMPFKLDVRNFVYRGEVQLLAGRLYRGQTTNFRTPGGGFAPIYSAAGTAPS